MFCPVKPTCPTSAMHIHWETFNVTITVQLNITIFYIVKKK